uniref:Uncharacterized protein n=1 Tax=viral metagenome TaxID=1070528 RepID=A0A6H2A0C4_9ZZZZ
MNDGADEARDEEEFWEGLKRAHNIKKCEPGCPYCDEEFEPLFNFQINEVG